LEGVIIVDDEEMIRFLIKQKIKSLNLGIEVVGEATDGQEGIILFQKLKPLIIISDIKMPSRNGLEMLTQIRKDSSDVIIIILSAYTEFNFAKEAISVGAFDYLLKPIEEEALGKTLYNASNKLKELHRSQIKLFKLEKEISKLKTDLFKQNSVGKFINPSSSDFIDDAIKYIDENFHYDISLQNIAKREYVCPTYMSEQFKKRTGENFSKYITNLRIENAKLLLKKPELKITEISDLLGYHDCSYFIRVFKSVTNKTPNEFRDTLKN
jgi:two-component system response regulator YesN